MPKMKFISKDGSLQGLLDKAYNRKPTEAELDKFCKDARKGTTPPAFDPEPEITEGGQRAAGQRAALSQVLNGLGLYN